MFRYVFVSLSMVLALAAEAQTLRYELVPAPAPIATTRFGTAAGVPDVDGGNAYVFSGAATSTASAPARAPSAFALESAAPNPFRSHTRLRYTLGTSTEVRLTVHDALGRPVAVLFDAARPTETPEAVFDGEAIPAGVYVVRLEADGHHQTRRVLLLR